MTGSPEFSEFSEYSENSENSESSDSNLLSGKSISQTINHEPTTDNAYTYHSLSRQRIR